MQEQNSEKVVSLSVRATKVTANVLKSAVRAYLSAQKNKSPKPEQSGLVHNSLDKRYYHIFTVKGKCSDFKESKN